MFFFNDTIYIYGVSVGSLFNNIYIQRIDKSVTPPKIEEIAVPLTYSGKEHWYYKKYKSLPDDSNLSFILPQISYSFTGLEIDNSRQNNKFEKMKFSGNMTREVMEWCQTAVPYTFSYTLNIWTKRISDMNQIIEQILPYFPANSRDIHINEIPFLNITRSAKLKLDGTNDDFTVEYEQKENRVIKYELSFSLDGFLYQPIKEEAIISQIDIGIYTSLLNGEEKYLLDAIINSNGDIVT